MTLCSGWKPLWAAVLVSLAAGCAHGPGELPAGDPSAWEECAPDAVPGPKVSAAVLPIPISPELAAKGPRETRGLMARRITATFTPQSVRQAPEIVWAKLSIRAYGGTIEGWTRLQGDGVLIEAVNPSAQRSASKRAVRERAAIDFAPGYLTVTRASLSSTPVTNALNVDLLILPGGIPIDEPVVRIPALWTSSGAPLAADGIRVELDPLRHVPGYDLIEAAVVMDYVSAPRKDQAACRASATTRVVLVDREAVRPPLWDVGASSTNGPRNRWLALNAPTTGVFRAVFDSPAAATSFANWIRVTRATSVGPYQIGVFQRDGHEPLRPLVPVDVAATRTFRALLPEETDSLRTGPLGEP